MKGGRVAHDRAFDRERPTTRTQVVPSCGTMTLNHDCVSPVPTVSKRLLHADLPPSTSPRPLPGWARCEGTCGMLSPATNRSAGVIVSHPTPRAAPGLPARRSSAEYDRDATGQVSFERHTDAGRGLETGCPPRPCTASAGAWPRPRSFRRRSMWTRSRRKAGGSKLGCVVDSWPKNGLLGRVYVAGGPVLVMRNTLRGRPEHDGATSRSALVGGQVPQKTSTTLPPNA